jgi:hypothetical protein
MLWWNDASGVGSFKKNERGKWKGGEQACMEEKVVVGRGRRHILVGVSR